MERSKSSKRLFIKFISPFLICTLHKSHTGFFSASTHSNTQSGCTSPPPLPPHVMSSCKLKTKHNTASEKLSGWLANRRISADAVAFTYWVSELHSVCEFILWQYTEYVSVAVCYIVIICSVLFLFQARDLCICVCTWVLFSAFLCQPFCQCAISVQPFNVRRWFVGERQHNRQQCASIHSRQFFPLLPVVKRRREKEMSLLLWFCYSMLCGKSLNLVEQVKDIKQNEFRRHTHTHSGSEKATGEKEKITQTCIYNM